LLPCGRGCSVRASAWTSAPRLTSWLHPTRPLPTVRLWPDGVDHGTGNPYCRISSLPRVPLNELPPLVRFPASPRRLGGNNTLAAHPEHGTSAPSAALSSKILSSRFPLCHCIAPQRMAGTVYTPKRRKTNNSDGATTGIQNKSHMPRSRRPSWVNR
jgi:hypothetical protein